MPALDTTGKAAVTSPAFAPAWFGLVDISGGPLRVTNYVTDVTFSSTGDSDLDGNTFVSWGGQFIDVGDVSNSESGSDTLTVTLSGITAFDLTLLNEIGNKSLWQGREFRLWFRAYDETGATPQGAIVPFYTGYMSAVKLLSDPKSQQIQVSVENWLAAFNQASNRTWLKQKDYDPNDTSAQATIAASNGMRRDSGAVTGPGTFAGGQYSGYGTAGGYGTYSPYPDAGVQSFDPNYLSTSRA